MTPKQLCRNLRFKYVFKYLVKPPTESWAAIALACGYYDQSHMINEFKHYTGSSPAAFFSEPMAIEKYFIGNF
jgi:AraC-like DNA-binding protein